MMRDEREHRLSVFVARLLERVVCEPAWHSAIDHSGAAIGKTEKAQMVWRIRQKAKGIKPSHLDWYCYQKETGIFTQFELKVGDNQPTDGQRTTMRLLTERNIPTACCWSIADVFAHLSAAGFALVPDAAQIAADIEAKHLAREQAAQRTQAPRPRQRKQKANPAAYAAPPELDDVLASL